ncbi:oocyte-expressed protein homolog [Pteropus medius]|uniref:oocyte-expressed protein homolog n=1 Tax=Pteropus vampyrus TaxID=132908 RepID=UPI00196A7954|nr:oocyte-expressed protein homolog [Pteropus giganteus]
MADHAGAVDQGDECMPAGSLDRLLRLPPPPPQIHTWKWRFPVQKLRDPIGVLPGGTVAESLFGSDRAMIPEMEWMKVDLVNPRNLAKITIFRHLCVQNQVKVVHLRVASRHQKHRA